MGTMMSRRTLGGMLAASGALAVARMSAQEAAPDATPLAGSDRRIDGVAGGGILDHMGAEVPFSLMAFSVPGSDGTQVIGGALHLVDRSVLNHPVEIDATEIVSLALLSARSTAGRQLTGFGTLNGHGHYPFMLQVEDLGAPGSGEDTFDLVFGEDATPFLSGEETSGCDCGGPGYRIRSNVVKGDLALLAEG